MKFAKEILIGNKLISRASEPFIIAEAGVNHNGDIDIAKKMVDAALWMGAHAIKFQAFKTEDLVLPESKKAPYQVNQTGSLETQSQMLKKLELSILHQAELEKYTREKNLFFLTTPFEETTLDELDIIDLPAYKVASSDVTNLPFLIKIAGKNKPIILSTGMSSLKELEIVLAEILPINKRIILLQCTANYPIADDEVNLRVITEYQKHFDCLVGFSDHTTGIGAAPFAVGMGARIIEKHFTLDRNMPGPDHQMSLVPDEFRTMVESIKKAYCFLGTGEKDLTRSEVLTRKFLQKKLVASRDIKKGEVYSLNNIIGKRTGGEGISTIKYKEILGKTVEKNLKKDEIIKI